MLCRPVLSVMWWRPVLSVMCCRPVLCVMWCRPVISVMWCRPVMWCTSIGQFILWCSIPPVLSGMVCPAHSFRYVVNGQFFPGCMICTSSHFWDVGSSQFFPLIQREGTYKFSVTIERRKKTVLVVPSFSEIFGNNNNKFTSVLCHTAPSCPKKICHFISFIYHFSLVNKMCLVLKIQWQNNLVTLPICKYCNIKYSKIHQTFGNCTPNV